LESNNTLHATSDLLIDLLEDNCLEKSRNNGHLVGDTGLVESA